MEPGRFCSRQTGEEVLQVLWNWLCRVGGHLGGIIGDRVGLVRGSVSGDISNILKFLKKFTKNTSMFLLFHKYKYFIIFLDKNTKFGGKTKKFEIC